MTPQLVYSEAADELSEERPVVDHVGAEMRAAIAAVLFENPRNLDIRPLWNGSWTSYFRVNWWTAGSEGTPRIRRSAFLVVTREQNGYRVRERDPRAA